MSGIILVALQILLLLLKAHFNKDSSQEKAIENIREAQSKLNEIAEKIELKLRYSAPPPEQIHHLQEILDKDKKIQSHKPAAKES
jgi:hypothetical protein